MDSTLEDAPSVAALVRAAAEGDAGAWSGLVARYSPLVLAVIRGFRLAEKDAEDVYQTLWLRLVEHLRDLREPKAIPQWIITTTRNECCRLLRTSRRVTPLPAFAAENLPASLVDDDDLDENLLRRERHEALLAGFAELPDHQRQLLILLLHDPPVSYQEISERLSIPIGSIGPTRARALARLRATPSVAALADSVVTNKGGAKGDAARLGREASAL